MKTAIQFLSPLIIIFIVIAVNNYININNSLLKNKARVYKYPKLVIYLLYACFTLPALLFFSPEKVSSGAKGQFNFIEILSSLIITFLIIYCSRYVVKLDVDKIEFGAFLKKEISYDSIKSVKYHWVNNGQFVKLTLDNGKSKTFEKGIDSFDDFAKILYEMLDKNKVTFSTAGKASFF